MRAALLILAFVALAVVSNAQLSLTPKAGIESSRTSINYNDLRCLSPLGAVASPQIGLRLDYKFKKTHGPYVGIATNRSVVAMRFDNPETGMTTYTAEPGNLGLRLEGGYTYSFKPIFFNRSGSSDKKEVKQNAGTKSGCNKSYTRSKCGDKSKKAPAIARKQGLNMRIQPSAGFAYVAGVSNNIETNTNGANYQFNAGNWKAAFVAGTDFEFGRGRDRMFTLGFQYIQGFDRGVNTITTLAGTKSTTTHLSSNSSAWNVTLGVPFTLSKKKSARPKQEVIKQKKQCIYYKPCRRV